MLNKKILTRTNQQIKEIVFSNYNFTNNFTNWSVGGSYSITQEGINNTNCAKLTNQYTGIYRTFTIDSNTNYRFDTIAKATTATNLKIVIKNVSTDADLVITSVTNSNNYAVFKTYFNVNLSSIKLGFEVFPGTGTFYINNVRLFKC